MVPFTKAHAYGNDFLYVRAADAGAGDHARLARRLCDRHTGVGADGLILWTRTADGAAMTLLNADGSPAELSGNGLRGVAALVARARVEAGEPAEPPIRVETTAGPRVLRLTNAAGARFTFVASMGRPERVRHETIEAAGERLEATVLSMGNPQCVVLGPLPAPDRFARLGPALERHARFPNGTNVEFAEVVSPTNVRILIWERGVGPTASSGTGTCAAAVAAILAGGAARQLDVAAPGGVQHVDWTGEDVQLTGWAEITCDGVFRAAV